MAKGFVHLHSHTEYSMLDGATRVRQALEKAARLGMPGMAITDHGVMYGVVEFYEVARAVGVKPILGVEAYVAPRSRFQREAREQDAPYHLTLLARDQEGYRNLLRLVSRAYLEGYWYKPRMDRELFAEHGRGIVALSGCLAGEIPQALLAGRVKEARRLAGEYAEIFGKDGFYIEIQDHGLPEQRRVLPELVELARRLGLKVVATNDLHYAEKADAPAHDVLLCIQTGSNVADPKRLRFGAEEFYLKGAEEMREVFRDLPEACDATLEIADSCQVELEFGGIRLPRYTPPDGSSEEAYLRRLVLEGARERYGDPLPPEVLSRLQAELAVIEGMGFAGYFLVVWDVVSYARSRGIRVGPGRGSAAGSIVSYCLGITSIDPLRYGLLFERFLNPERVQMPDIDLDFDERRRPEVIEYVRRRYGEDRVAQIVTFSTIKAKQAIRDAARVLGYPYGFGDKLAKMMPPPVLGREWPLEKAFELSQELAEAYNKDPDARKVLDTARVLEGLRRQDSVHAAGVVISDRPLTEYMPVQRKELDGPVVTQFDMHAVEKLGLLKVDFLGLRNLSIIEDTCDLVARTRGTRPDVDNLPLDDPEVYAMLRRGETTGVFQLESPGMRTLLRILAPDRFEDLMAVVSLYRPGPLGEGMHVEYAERKQGRKPVSYLHPDLKAILEETYGIIVYQEQAMRIAMELAGYSAAEADSLRKAMGKKIPEAMAAQRERFVRGCVEWGYPEALAEKLFEAIEHFAGYGFNKSHACGYALLAYQTAWLKSHYPVEYMAAVLTSVKGDKDKTGAYLNACRRMGIRILPPDVNLSEADHLPEGNAIRFGLSAIRNLGEHVVEAIVAERKRGGPFRSVEDFLARVGTPVLNRRILESLIKAGAFDSLGYSRGGLLKVCESLLEAAAAARKAEEAGQASLFSLGTPAAEGRALPVPEEVLPREELLAWEREMLGHFVSDHPLLGLEEVQARATDASLAELGDLADGEVRTVGGVVTAVTKRFTRRGEPMATMVLEDLEGSAEVVLFPSVYQSCASFLGEAPVVLVKGRVDAREDSPKLVALEVRRLRPDEAAEGGALAGGDCEPFVISLEAEKVDDALVSALKRVLLAHPGNTPVHLRLRHGSRNTLLRLGEEYCVTPSEMLREDLRRALDPLGAGAGGAGRL